MGCSESKVKSNINSDKDDKYVEACKKSYNLVNESDVDIIGKITGDTSDAYLETCKTKYNLNNDTCVGFKNINNNMSQFTQNVLNSLRKTHCDTEKTTYFELFINEIIDSINRQPTPPTTIEEFNTAVTNYFNDEISRNSIDEESAHLLKLLGKAIVDDSLIKINEEGQFVFDKEAFKVALKCDTGVEGTMGEYWFTRTERPANGISGYRLRYGEIQKNIRKNTVFIDMAIVVMIFIIMYLLRNSK